MLPARVTGVVGNLGHRQRASQPVPAAVPARCAATSGSGRLTAPAENGDTYAEVAHEAIFRRWEKLRDWITAEREFLTWRTGLETARRAWQVIPNNSNALLMGFALVQAQRWLSKRPADISEEDQRFVSLSRSAARRKRILLVVGLLSMALLGSAGAAWLYQAKLNEMPAPADYQSTWMSRVRAATPQTGTWEFDRDKQGHPILQFRRPSKNISFYLGVGRAVGLWIAYPAYRPNGDATVTLVTGYSTYTATSSYREWKLKGEYVNEHPDGFENGTFFRQWDLGLARTNNKEFSVVIDFLGTFLDSLTDSTQSIVSTDDGLLVFPKIDVPNLKDQFGLWKR